MSQNPEGRELDTLIEEKVFGRKVSSWSLHLASPDNLPTDKEWRHGMFSAYDFNLGREAEILVADAQGDMPIVESFDGKNWNPIPHYSTSVADAWEVVEKLQAEGWVLELDTIDGTTATFWHPDRVGARWTRKYSTAETTPLSICLAALAVESEK